MVCVGLLTRIRISGAACFCASVVDAGLASGLAGELVRASCDWGYTCVSAADVPVLKLWEAEPAVLGLLRLGAGYAGAWSLRVRAGLGARRKNNRRSHRNHS